MYVPRLARTVACAALAILPPTIALAAAPPTGTIFCAVASEPSYASPKGLRFRPYIALSFGNTDTATLEVQ